MVWGSVVATYGEGLDGRHHVVNASELVLDTHLEANARESEQEDLN